MFARMTALTKELNRWRVLSSDSAPMEDFARRTGLSAVAATILWNRGMRTSEEVRCFLHPSLAGMEPPFGMLDMGAAVERILSALERRETVAVYGDYDADGVTATALLHLFLKEIGLPSLVYLPNRFRDGYGLNRRALEALARQGVTLVITVDCGVSDHREVETAHRLGMDVIVTDHHEPPPHRTSAAAVINPKQSSCPYPHEGLAGVGVALNLAVALRAALRTHAPANPGAETNLKSYLDLVALGTIADLVPLTGQNRILAKAGLEVLSNGPRPGLAALKRVAAVNGPAVSGEDVAFRLAPRLNAAGRMGDPMEAFELLVAEDSGTASRLAAGLEQRNVERKGAEGRLFRVALAQAGKRGREPQGGIVLAGADWHLGIIGLIASKIREHFNLPTLVVSLNGGMGHGSGRGVPGMNLVETLRACKDYLVSFGGHAGAVGFRVKEERLADFAGAFQEVASQNVRVEVEVAPICVDARVPLDSMTYETALELERLGPFGQGNPEPVFLSEGVCVVSKRWIREKHLVLNLMTEKGRSIRAVGFNMEEGTADSAPGSLDLVYTPSVNRYGGKDELQLRILDVSPSPL